MKIFITLIPISLFVLFSAIDVNALNYTRSVNDTIQNNEDVSQKNIYQEKIIYQKDQQIANLTSQITDIQKTENTNLTIGVVGIIVGLGGIVGMIYEIKKKRALAYSQLMTDKAKRSAYRATKEAKMAERNKHNIESGKKLWDWFTGK